MTPLRGTLRALESKWSAILLVAVAAIVAGCKLRMISFYGSDVPFGDQWFGEAAALYLPYLRGNLHWQDFFTPHNEHRIVFTRLVDLTMLIANGQWDSRLLLVVNAGVHLAAVVTFLVFALQRVNTIGKIALGVVGAIAFSTSAAWENTLWAFQSQFYFVLLFSALHIILSFSRPFGSAGWWAGQVAGLCNLGAMAGGWLSAAAVLITVFFRMAVARRTVREDWILIGWNLGLAGVGMLLMVHVPAHDRFRAASPSEFIAAFSHFLSWPMARPALGFAVYAPVVAWAALRIRNKNTEGMAVLALAVFAVSECAVLAYARGAIFSRYVDTLALGVMISLLCLLELPVSVRFASLKACLAGLWLALVVGGIWRQEDISYDVTLSHQEATNAARASAVRSYVRSADFQALKNGEGWSDAEASAIATVLNVPELRAILPVSVAAPVRIEPLIVEKFAPMPMKQVSDPRSRDDLPSWTTMAADGQSGRFISRPVRARLPILSFYATGYLSPPQSSLVLQTEKGRLISPLQQTLVSPGRWKMLNFENPGEPFQVVATVNNSRSSFAFTAPLESGRFTWLARRVVGSWPVILSVGVGLFVIAVAAGVKTRLEN